MVNNDGSWMYKCNLPNPLVKNKWFHFRYRVMGNRISQWANEVLIQTTTVGNEWMIPRGGMALGCHSGSPHGCRTFYDNIKVRLLVEPKPTLSVENKCQFNCQTGPPAGTKEHPADSCKQIHDSNLSDQTRSSAKNGVYWIKSSQKCNEGIQTFCDMTYGGWTLVGKINGQVGNIYSKWLVENVNTKDLKTPKIDSRKTVYSCLDARLLAVQNATEVILSSGDNSEGIGRKWVKWELPSGREYNTWWNHGVGQSTVQTAGTSQVTVKAWNGNTKVREKKKPTKTFTQLLLAFRFFLTYTYLSLSYKLPYYIDTDEIPGFLLLRKNHIFTARSEDTIFSFTCEDIGVVMVTKMIS